MQTNRTVLIGVGWDGTRCELAYALSGRDWTGLEWTRLENVDQTPKPGVAGSSPAGPVAVANSDCFFFSELNSAGAVAVANSDCFFLSSNYAIESCPTVY